MDLRQLSPRELGDSNDPRAIPLLRRFLHAGTVQQRTHSASAIRKLSSHHLAECKAAVPELLACATSDHGREQALLRQYSLLALEQLEPTIELGPSIERILQSERIDYVKEVASRIHARIEKARIEKYKPLELTAIRAHLARFQVRAFWHITHIDNLADIIKFGIVNHHRAHRKKPTLTDISDPSVQRWRERSDPVYHRAIHEYAPLYINPRNPMLYRRKNIAREICIIEVSVDILASCQYLISDGNAASSKTRFFSSLQDLPQLPWTTLSSTHWSNHEDGKRKMCAEVLIFPRIWPAYITGAHFCALPDCQLAIPRQITTIHSPNLFFC